MEPYQSQYSNRDSVEFQNFSKSLAEAVNLVFRDLPGTHRASLVRIQWVDHFLCILTTFQLLDEYFIRSINLAFDLFIFLVKNKIRFTFRRNWVSIKGLKYTYAYFLLLGWKTSIWSVENSIYCIWSPFGWDEVFIRATSDYEQQFPIVSCLDKCWLIMV